MGNRFEQSLLLYTDMVIMELMENNRVPKGSVQDLFELIVRQVDGLIHLCEKPA